MRKILRDFYFGNLTPSERQMTHNSDLMRAAAKATRYEQQLTEQLDETGQALLTALVKAQNDIDSITACENFILGFRLGVRMMAECMDENDGDIQGIVDPG
ncbi:MAG: hypothetical protein K1W21_19575 [Oscillospiraceae bacterium]